MYWPDYYAKQLRDEHPLSWPATRDELLAICAKRGIHIRWTDLDHPGIYVRLHVPVMFLRRDASARVIAHELYHDLKADNEQRGRVYAYTREPETLEELEAQAFEVLLCAYPTPLEFEHAVEMPSVEEIMAEVYAPRRTGRFTTTQLLPTGRQRRMVRFPDRRRAGWLPPDGPYEW